MVTTRKIRNIVVNEHNPNEPDSCWMKILNHVFHKKNTSLSLTFCNGDWGCGDGAAK